MILLVSVIIFFSTLFGGLFALKYKDKLHLILGFSAGALIGLVFFDMLPEAISLGNKQYNFAEITSVSMLGFLIYMILDRLAILHSHQDHAEGGLKTKMGAGSLSLHCFMDGIAIGWSFQISPSIGITTAFAVIAHDFSDGINIVTIILKEESKNKKALIWLVANAILPVIGIISSYFISMPDASFGLILALFSGFFLYIGVSDLLPFSSQKYPGIWTTLMTILGSVVMYLATRFSL